MTEIIEHPCPYCGNLLQVHKETGAVEKKIKTKEETFTDALKKIADDKVKRKDQFEQIQQDLSKKKKESDDLFKKNLNEIKEKGLGDKPIREIDL